MSALTYNLQLKIMWEYLGLHLSHILYKVQLFYYIDLLIKLEQNLSTLFFESIQLPNF